MDERPAIDDPAVWYVLIIAAIGMCMIVAAVLMATPARGHSWYESDCCSGIDCAPVADELIEERADGVHVQGFGVLAYGDPRLRWSRDHQKHLCAQRSLFLGTQIRCVYLKPGSA